MKIGILTQSLHANYGGLLQNYALQQTLIRAGHDVETIDWGKPKSLRYRLYCMKMQFLATWFPRKNPGVRYQPSKVNWMSSGGILTISSKRISGIQSHCVHIRSFNLKQKTDNIVHTL